MFDLKLRLGHFDFAGVEEVRNFTLLRREALGFLVLKRSNRDDRKARIDLCADIRFLSRSDIEALVQPTNARAHATLFVKQPLPDPLDLAALVVGRNPRSASRRDVGRERLAELFPIVCTIDG